MHCFVINCLVVSALSSLKKMAEKNVMLCVLKAREVETASWNGTCFTAFSIP